MAAAGGRFRFAEGRERDIVSNDVWIPYVLSLPSIQTNLKWSWYFLMW